MPESYGRATRPATPRKYIPPVSHPALLLTGISQLVTPRGDGRLHGRAMGELDIIPDAAIGISSGRITWVGPARDAPTGAPRAIDLGGKAVVPGLVDPHTHAVWGGDRLADFDARVRGVPYEEILAGAEGSGPPSARRWRPLPRR